MKYFTCALALCAALFLAACGGGGSSSASSGNTGAPGNGGVGDVRPSGVISGFPDNSTVGRIVFTADVIERIQGTARTSIRMAVTTYCPSILPTALRATSSSPTATPWRRIPRTAPWARQSRL